MNLKPNTMVINMHIEEIKEASLKFHAGKLLTAKVVYKELEDHWLNILRPTHGKFLLPADADENGFLTP